MENEIKSCASDLYGDDGLQVSFLPNLFIYHFQFVPDLICGSIFRKLIIFLIVSIAEF